MDKKMFCFQCEQTIGCSGCTGNSGVCGKPADTAKLQDDMLTPKEFQKAVNVAIQLDTQKPVIDDNRGQYSMNLMIICLPELLEKQ